MNVMKPVLLSAASLALFALPTHKASAQISVGINFGSEPSCPYGYYDYEPYSCAPYGYYGPEWFVGGRFLGAGHWFHGPANFHGHVNNSYDPHHGYKGPLPEHGPVTQHPDNFKSFHANESRDGRGHTTDEHGGHH